MPYKNLFRTLWLVADQAREDSHMVGEVLEGSALQGPAARDFRPNLFVRLRTRASVAVACSTAMRLDMCVP